MCEASEYRQLAISGGSKGEKKTNISWTALSTLLSYLVLTVNLCAWRLLTPFLQTRTPIQRGKVTCPRPCYSSWEHRDLESVIPSFLSLLPCLRILGVLLDAKAWGASLQRFISLFSGNLRIFLVLCREAHCLFTPPFLSWKGLVGERTQKVRKVLETRGTKYILFTQCLYQLL